MLSHSIISYLNMFIFISVALKPIHAIRSLRLGPLSRSSMSMSSRPASNGLPLDTNLLANSPDTVISHLVSRKASESVISEVLKVKELKATRNALIVEGDSAKNVRKTLSKQIGELMKNKEMEEANKLKVEVENANKISAQADEKLSEIDRQIESILSVIPNLLDDR